MALPAGDAGRVAGMGGALRTSHGAGGACAREQESGRSPMVQEPNEDERALHHTPGECAKLIRKLRWIGLEDEARSLQRALSTLPAERRASVLSGPFNTD